MRDPSIHITESELANILSKIWEAPPFVEKGWEKEMAKKIVRLAKGKALNSRSITLSSELVEKKINKQLRAKTGDTKLMAEIIYLIRYRKGHRGIAKIKEGSAEYTKLKGLVEVAIQFCNDFGLDKKQGFTKYLEIGFKRISSSLNYIVKLINMSETISEIYQAEEIINNDTNKAETEKIVEYYTTRILNETGMLSPLIYQDTKKFVKFVEVRELTDKLDVPYKIYIDAQFHGLEWTDSYPEPNQLVGDKAIERLNKYMFENKLKVNKKVKKVNDISSKLKRLGK